jgi:superfamily I DNA/RNA helicase
MRTITANVREVWGPPGTGKTTTLADAVQQHIDHRRQTDIRSWESVIVCSLTNSAAREIASRGLDLNPRCVGTLHSLAMRMIGMHRDEIVYTAERLDDWSATHPEWALKHIDDAIGRASGRGAPLHEEYHLLRNRMVPRDEWPDHVRAFGDAWMKWKREAEALDFADIIQLAADETELPVHASLVVADEAQDYSALELDLLVHLGNMAGNLVIAGDPDQALYRWRGAHPEIFLDVPESNRTVLDQSYRVPRAVHNYAMTLRERLSYASAHPIEYRPRDAEGAVVVGESSLRDANRLLDEEALGDIESGRTVMFAASCSYMLRPLIDAMRRRKLLFCNPWRPTDHRWTPVDLQRGAGERIVSVVNPITERRPWTVGEVWRFIEFMRARGVVRRGAKKWLERYVTDKTAGEVLDDLGMVLEPREARELESAWSANDPEEALAWWRGLLIPRREQQVAYPLDIVRVRGLDALLAEPNIYVGTIHSFKGAEADIVYLFPDLSRAGFEQIEGLDRADNDDVTRMFYVGATRALEKLVLCPAMNDRSFNYFVDEDWTKS